MKHLIFTLAFLLGLNFNLTAQQYYVALDGDTVYGKTHINEAVDNSREIRFVTDAGEKLNLTPRMAKEVFHSNDRSYRPVFYQRQWLFMNVIQEGRLSVYNYVYKDGGNTLLSKVLVKDNEAIEVNKFGFKNQMEKFLGDCPEIVTGIENKTYRLRDLQDMAIAYNNCNIQPQSNPEVADPQPVAPVTEAGSLKENLPPATKAKSTESSSADQINSFRDYITSLTDLDNKGDVLELLKDLENRWQQEGQIPGYLWSALEGMAGGHQGLGDRINGLKTSLGNQ